MTDLDAGLSTAVVLLFATTTFLQFSSTVLLSDLHLGTLPGLSANLPSTYDFEYKIDNGTSRKTPGLGFSLFFGSVSYPIQLRTSTWLRNPPAYPAFAEYTKSIESREGVDDTGTLLRAFLPFADAQSRETIRNYSGTAMVLDSRVSCFESSGLKTVLITGNRSRVKHPSFLASPSLQQSHSGSRVCLRILIPVESSEASSHQYRT